MFSALPKLGVGLGYRSQLHQEIMDHRAHIDFLEVVTDQYIHTAPERADWFVEATRDFPLVAHGVSLSVGTDMPPDPDYVEKTAAFVRRIGAPWFSDHLCFTRVDDLNIEQLTPLWFTEESLEVVCRNLAAVKAAADTPFLLENITYYFPLPLADMTEAEFITRVLETADCGMLLDVNNVHINSVNLGFDPYEFVRSLPLERVVQVHIAGGRQMLGMIVDTHGAPIRPEVWGLLEFVVANSPVKGVVLEWDQDFPPFAEIVATLERAREIVSRHA